MLKKISSLVLDSDVNARIRLRETLKSIALKSEVEFARTLMEALAKLEASRFDCVFVSSGIGADLLEEAIQKIRRVPRSSKLLLIISLKPADQDTTKVANLFMQGSNGFICEPYSADEIVQLIENARKGKDIEGADHNKLLSSAALLVRSAMAQIDQLAFDRTIGKMGKGYAGRELERLSSSLKEMAPKIGDRYGDILVEAFCEAKVPKAIPAFLRKRKEQRMPPHPGLIVAKLLRERSISIEKLASTSGIAQEQLILLLDGKDSITDSIADPLARALGESRTYWLARQKEYDAYQQKMKKHEDK